MDSIPTLKTMKNNEISKLDPSIILNWNDDVVFKLMQLANTPEHMNHLPSIFTSVPGAATLVSVKMDIIMHLSTFAGGVRGNNFLGPSNLLQFSRIISAMRSIEHDSIMQQFMNVVLVPLASAYYIADYSNFAASMPLALGPPPHPIRAVFE